MNKYIIAMVLIVAIVLIGIVGLVSYNVQVDHSESNYTESDCVVQTNNTKLTVEEFREKYNVSDNYSYPVTGEVIKASD